MNTRTSELASSALKAKQKSSSKKRSNGIDYMDQEENYDGSSSKYEPLMGGGAAAAFDSNDRATRPSHT